MSTPKIIASSAQVAQWTFPGGIFPEENKHQSMQLPIGSLPIPTELVFPLSQHMGVPAEPIVNVGDKVLGGQKIAEAVGAFSVPVHASTSGTITAIEERTLPHPSGMSGLCIILSSDGEHQQVTTEACDDYTQYSSDILIKKIRDAGIAGLGGAGFPTAIKLKPQAQYAIDTLILNGTECEPYITADHSLMLHHADEVIAGAKLLAFILDNPKNIILGVEDNKPDAIEALAAAASGTNIQIMTFPTKYPSGGEKQLIQILTGKEVPSGSIPANLGIVMQNVGTAVAAHRAVSQGQALTSRITTFVGKSLQQQQNINILLGTPIHFALEQLGYDASNNERLVMGGPMMGFALETANTPVVKTTNCIIAPEKQELAAPQPAQECIRCGHCAEACPASLLPQQLYWYAKAEEYDRAQNHHLFDCIECGACAYVCPSNIPLVQYYRSAKGTIREKEQEKVKSDHARQRFEFRKFRLEKAEADKEAKRQARKKAAEAAKKLQAEKKKNASSDNNTNASAPDPVAAALARVKQQQDDPVAQQGKLERALVSSRSRVEKLKEKLNNSEADQHDKITAQIKQAEVRLQEAEKQQSDFLASQASNSQDTKPAGDKVDTKANANKDTKASIDNNDAASLAIEKAKKSAAALASMSPEEKRNKQIDALEQRLVKAKQRLANAEAENNEHIDAFRNGVEKIAAKLAATKAELDQ